MKLANLLVFASLSGPVEASIRYYSVKIPGGTTKLRFSQFDNNAFYLKVYGLCDFDIPKKPKGVADSGYLRAFKNEPMKYDYTGAALPLHSAK